MPDALIRQELEQRRLQAGQLLLRGMRQSEVASRLQVSRETVRRWADKVGEGGLDALRNAPQLGRPSGLSLAQRQELGLLLQQGAVAQGFSSDGWSLHRVGQLIEQRFGRRYSEVQVWRILGGLGWSHQQGGRASGSGARRNGPRVTREWMQKR